MKESTVTLPGGGKTTTEDAINALAREAKRRDTSYGVLVATTEEWERAEIIREYCAEKRRKRKK